MSCRLRHAGSCIGVHEVCMEGQSGHPCAVFCAVYHAGQSLRCVLNVDAADLRAGLWTAPCGHGNGWHSLYRHLPDGGEALQPLARHRSHCRAACDGGCLGASCAHKWYYQTFPPQRTAIIYDERHGMEKLINEYGLNHKYNVHLTMSAEECLADRRVLDGMETVFVSGVHSHE